MGLALIPIWRIKFENEKQINNFFERNKDDFLRVAYILSQIEFSYKPNKSNTKFTHISIIRLYLFRIIKGIGNYKILIEYLTKHEDEAFLLGFFKDENNCLILPKKRTFNNYLSQFDWDEWNLVAKEILLIATKKNILLDLEIVKDTLRKKKKTYEKEQKETIRLIKKLIYPKIGLKIKSNGKFTTTDLLDVLVHVSFTNCCVNNGSELFKVINENRKTPSGDLMMYHFSKFKSEDKLKMMFDNILDFVFDFCKRNYKDLQRRKLDIAYDVHPVPYYGKQMNYVCGGKHDRGTSSFFKFLTCSIVVAGKRFILDVTPVHALSSLEKLIDTSLGRVRSKIRIDKVYLDRGFDRRKIIHVLNKHKVKFLMPKTKSVTVKSWFDKSEDCKSRVIKDFQIGKGSGKALANLVLVNNKKGVKRAFICNFDIAPCLAYRFYELYSLRWGIETAYRGLEHDFKAKTTSRNYNIRLFYFLFSSCLHNLWVLVNICVGLLIYGRIQEKPIITKKMFVAILYMVQVEYFDDGG